MGTEAIGYVLGQQCAPVIAGVKPSNLLIVEKGNQNGLKHVLKGTALCRYLLYTSDKKDYWFLFDQKKLEQVLLDAEKAQYLQECGYPVHCQASSQTGCQDCFQAGLSPADVRNPLPATDAVLNRLAEHFRNYKEGNAAFPHEMGIFFGYPLSDVKGFVENKGQNFKMSGYWKVYDDVAYADRIFRLYESAKKTVLDLFGQGMRISDIWQQFHIQETAAAVSTT